MCAHDLRFILLGLSLAFACDGEPESQDPSSSSSTADPGSTSEASSSGGPDTSASSSTGDGSSTSASDPSSSSSGSSSGDAGSSSSTGGGDVCGPPAPSDPVSVSLQGADFEAVDAVAVMTELENVATEDGNNPYRNELRIRLSANPDACSREDEAIFRRGETLFQLLFMRNGADGFPGLPEPGTYPLDQTLPMANDGTTYFRGAGVVFDCQDTCTLCGSMIQNQAGSVTLTTVTSEMISGTFEYSDTSGSYSGSFEAPLCGSTEPEPAQCCWTP